MAVILVFFFWPAGQALYQSVLQQDAFGSTSEFVGLENFERLFRDPGYLESFKTTAVFSALVAVSGLTIALLLAVMANRVVRAAGLYKTLLIWPYATAPVVAGVLWLMMFASPYGALAYGLRELGFEWNHVLNGNHAMALIVMAAVWKQISYNFLFFPGRIAVDPRIRRSSRHDLTAPPPAGASGPSSFRCCRPPLSSCW